MTRVKVTGSPPYKATIAAKTSISIHGTRDKLNPPAIASFETSRKVFLDVIPRRVRPLGAGGGLTRIGLVVVGWVRTMWVSQSSKPACGTCFPLSLCPLGSVLAKQDPAGSTVLLVQLRPPSNAAGDEIWHHFADIFIRGSKYPNRLTQIRKSK